MRIGIFLTHPTSLSIKYWTEVRFINSSVSCNLTHFLIIYLALRHSNFHSFHILVALGPSGLIGHTRIELERAQTDLS